MTRQPALPQISRTGPSRTGSIGRVAPRLVAGLVGVALFASGGFVSLTASAAPAKPTAVSATPSDGSIAFAWSPVPGASAYKLEVSRSGNFTGTPDDTAASPTTYATSWIAPTTLDLSTAGDLWYRVSAYGTGVTESTRGEPSTPQLLSRDALAAPQPLAPEDGATIDYPSAVGFSWTAVAGAVSYDVEYIAGDFASSSATSVTARTTATALVPQKPLTPGLGYQWRVRANFYSGSTSTSVPGAVSVARSFFVRWPSAASQPTLLSPANSGSDPIVSDPQLRWAPVPGAKNYQVLLGKSKDSSGNIVSPSIATVTGTAYIPRLEFSNTNYFWQVVANDANGGAGTPSQVWQFKKALSYSADATTTGAAAEVYPEPLTGSADRANPTVIPLDELELRWEPIPRATLYEVQVVPAAGDRLTCLTASTSATVVAVLTATGTEHDTLKGAGGCLWHTQHVKRIRVGSTYSWRVRAVDYLGSASTKLQDSVPSAAITSEWSDEEVDSQESRERWFTVAEPVMGTNTRVVLNLDAFESQTVESLRGQPAPLLTWQPFDFTPITDSTERVGYEVTIYAKGVGSSTQVAVVRTPQTRLRINGVFDDNEVAEPYSASVRPFVLTEVTTPWTTTTELVYVSGHSADRFSWTKTSKTIDISPGPQTLPDGTAVLTWKPQFDTAPLDGGSRGYAITIRDSAEAVVGTAGYKVDLPFLVAQTYSSQNDSVGKPLPQGNYTYEVAPLDANGNATRYSRREAFTISFPPPTVGSAPEASGASQLVTWSPSTAAFKYQLRYKLASAASTSWVTVGTTSTSVGASDRVQTSHVFADLAPGSYVWQLRSVDTAGNVSSWSPEQSFTIGGRQVELTTPDRAVLQVADRALHWNPVAGVSRYILEVSTNSNLSSATSYETLATAFTVPTPLTAGTSYYWRVKAVPELATTSSSRPVLATSEVRSFSALTVPATVTGARATPDGTSLQLTWTALTGAGAGTPEAPRYVIQVRPKGLTDDWEAAQTITTQAAATSLLVSRLASATTYEARISALNSQGQGPWSAVVSATTASAPSAAPSSLKLTQGVGSLTVSWRAPTGTGTGNSPITGYLLRYRTNANPWTQVKLGTITSHTLDGLATDTQYAVEVAAVNAIGTGPAATATSTTLGAPGMVSSFAVARGDKSAKLSWRAPASTGGSPITSYLVERRSYNASTRTWSSWGSTTVKTTSLTVTGLANGITYQFRVAARTALATGSYSAQASVTPAGKPGASPKVTLTASKGKFTISWKAAPNNGAALTSYTVQYSTNGKTWKTLKTTSGSTLKTTTTVGKKGKTYYFRIAAKNAVGTGPYSKVVKAKRK